jgi:hypothetical protein
MCKSLDEECQSLQGQDLSDQQWDVLQVIHSIWVFVWLNFFCLFIQEAVSVFEPLAYVSKFMEGEGYILASSYFGALRTIEDVLQPRDGDFPEVAQLRSTMFNDHFSYRVTLDQAVKSPLHVLGTLLDPRYLIHTMTTA